MCPWFLRGRRWGFYSELLIHLAQIVLHQSLIRAIPFLNFYLPEKRVNKERNSEGCRNQKLQPKRYSSLILKHEPPKKFQGLAKVRNWSSTQSNGARCNHAKRNRQASIGIRLYPCRALHLIFFLVFINLNPNSPMPAPGCPWRASSLRPKPELISSVTPPAYGTGRK